MHTDIDRGRRMRERPDGDGVRAAGRHVADLLQGHPSGDLDDGPAFDDLYGVPDVSRVHVIQQNHVRSSLQRLFNLGQGFHLHDDP